MGRIEGTVTLSRQLSARKTRIRAYAEYGPGAIPPTTPADTNELPNVVLYLDSGPFDAAPPVAAPSGLAVEQRHEAFRPHVLPVLAGWTVAFPNRDPIFHNVFSLSAAKTFDLGRYPQNSSKSVRFDKPGIVQVFCHIHSDMSAVVLVLRNRYFTVPDAGGRYTLDGVPPGEYRIVAWHERTKPTARTVRVVPGETAVVDFNIPLPPLEPQR
jgi:plastocyanin